MNLFLLSLNPKECAEYYANTHVSKILLEICQMLYTCWFNCGDKEQKWRLDAPSNGYKPYCPNNKLILWLGKSTENYSLASSIGMELSKEYTFRFLKEHSCDKHINWLFKNIPTSIPKIPITQMPQLMCKEYKEKEGFGTIEDTVKAYRSYYIYEKYSLLKYTNRDWPLWIPQNLLIEKNLNNVKAKEKEKEKIISIDKKLRMFFKNKKQIKNK